MVVAQPGRRVPARERARERVHRQIADDRRQVAGDHRQVEDDRQQVAGEHRQLAGVNHQLWAVASYPYQTVIK